MNEQNEIQETAEGLANFLFLLSGFGGKGTHSSLTGVGGRCGLKTNFQIHITILFLQNEDESIIFLIKTIECEVLHILLVEGGEGRAVPTSYPPPISRVR